METQIKIIFLFFVSQVFGKFFDPDRAVAQAIDQMLQIHFVKNSPKVDLIFFGNIKNSQNIMDFLMQNNKDQISFQVIDGNRFDSQQILLNSSSILFFESVHNFFKALTKIEWQVNYNENLNDHLVYFRNNSVEVLQYIKMFFTSLPENLKAPDFQKMFYGEKKV